MVTKLYKSYVRPFLESSVQAWRPWLKRDIDAIEKVQRRATRLVSGIASKSYEERLAICNLTSLEDRRERGDMIQCFKIMNNLTCIDKNNFFSYAKDRHTVNTRGAAEEKLVPVKAVLELRKNFYTSRVVNKWNNLPIEIRCAPSVNSFKNQYDSFI